MPRPSTYPASSSPLSSYVAPAILPGCSLRCRWDPPQRRRAPGARPRCRARFRTGRPPRSRPRPRRTGRAASASRISTPSALSAPPKYSPTTAPIIASTVATFRPGEDERQRRRDAHAPEDLHLARRVGVHQLEILRPHGCQAAQRVHHHREEAEHGGDHDLRALRQAAENHWFVIGAKAMIGIAFAAIAYGISAVPSGRQRASTSATRIAMPEPSDEAAERLLEREPARAPRAPACRVPERSSRSPTASAAGTPARRASDQALPERDRRRRGRRPPAASR